VARLRHRPGPAANGLTRPAESSSRSSKCERARRAASRARPAYDAPLQHHRCAQPERASRYAYLRAPRFPQCAARLPCSGVSAGISRSAVASPFARGKLDPGREPPMLPGPGMPRRVVAPAFSVCVERARPPITPCAPAREGERQRNVVRCATVSHKLVRADLAETRHPVAGSVRSLDPLAR
jgi:hypothetical protein